MAGQNPTIPRKLALIKQSSGFNANIGPTNPFKIIGANLLLILFFLMFCERRVEDPSNHLSICVGV